MRFPTAWRGTGGIESQPGGYTMPVAEPLPPSQYVTFPTDYAPPARAGGFQPYRDPWSAPPLDAWSGDRLQATSYAKWLKRTKFLAKYLGASAMLASLYEAYENRAPGAWGAPEWGFMPGPGWTVTCTSLNGMPNWGPIAQYGGYPVSTSCALTATGFVPGVTWYDPLPPAYAPGGYGLVDHLNGNYSCGYARQITPSLVDSPHIYFWAAFASAIGVGPAGGGHPEWAGVPFAYRPVPDAVQKSASVSGHAAPLPTSVASRSDAHVLPRGGTAPGPSPSPGPVRRPPGVPPSVRLDDADRPGRPEPRTRERKFRAGGIVGKVLAMLSTATEIADFFDAAYWALPSFVRKACKAEHGIGALARMECVMENPSQVDPETFLKNFLKNMAQDEAFGRFGRLVKGAHDAAYRFTGRDAVHGFQRAHAPAAPQQRWHRTADGWRFGL